MSTYRQKPLAALDHVALEAMLYKDASEECSHDEPFAFGLVLGLC